MTDHIELAVRENLAFLARDPARHSELWALATDRDRELTEVKAAVETLLQSDLHDPTIDDVLIDAFLNKLLYSEPFETSFFDSGAPGGSDELAVYELPNGGALVSSMGDGWRGPYASVDEAIDVCGMPTINIWLSDDFSEELSAVPEDVDSIKIDGEPYTRFDGAWHPQVSGPTYVLHRGTWMDESDALDAEGAEPS